MRSTRAFFVSLGVVAVLTSVACSNMVSAPVGEDASGNLDTEPNASPDTQERELAPVAFGTSRVVPLNRIQLRNVYLSLSPGNASDVDALVNTFVFSERGIQLAEPVVEALVGASVGLASAIVESHDLSSDDELLALVTRAFRHPLPGDLTSEWLER
ncbi:MAG: hypothetical protein AAFQ82_23275, partial [Myxococcota bacterium]